MDVPTVVSFSSLQQHSAEQIVDIQVPGTLGDHGGLQGFHPRQGWRSVEQLVDILVPGGGLQTNKPTNKHTNQPTNKQRRRDRRLRMCWRHEQLTLQMALAAALHHRRSQETARAEATKNSLRSQTNNVAGDTELFSLFEDELSGRRPEAFAELRPQDRVERHTVEYISASPTFRSSMCLCRRWGTSWWNSCRGWTL